MCSMTGFDLCYEENSIEMQTHCCRIVECEGGYTFEEAVSRMISYHHTQARKWATGDHPDYIYYKPEED